MKTIALCALLVSLATALCACGYTLVEDHPPVIIWAPTGTPSPILPA